MADNTILKPGTGGDTIRTIDRDSVKTQVVQLCQGGGGAESLVTSSSPLVVAAEIDPSDIALTGSITANGQVLFSAVDFADYRWISVQCEGTYNLTYKFEGSNDGTVWRDLQLWPHDWDGSKNESSRVGAIWSGGLNARYFRLRSTAYTSGTLNVTLFGTSLPMPPWVTMFTVPSNGLLGSAGWNDSNYFGTAIVMHGQQYAYDQGVDRAVRTRAPSSIAALSSSARTATTSGSDVTNYGFRGLHAQLNVSAASGTGGLSLKIQGKDPISGVYYDLNAAPAAVTATGLTVYELYPGIGAAGGGVTQRTSAVLPKTFRARVEHGDASSYTYSVATSLLP